MPLRRLRRLHSDEEGFALIEILVSALIVALVSAAVAQTLIATGRASSEQRHRSQAYAVAQEDQARLRAMQIATLQQGLAPRTVTVGGTPFTVTSTATYVSDKTGTTRCSGEGHADYVQIGSSVTWPTMRAGAAPVKIESIDSAVSGSVEANSGGLALTVANGAGQGLTGVGLSASGAATFSGATNSEGCALFGGQPAGEYTITPTLPGTVSWVEMNGNEPQPFKVTVTGGLTTSETVHYDHPGSLKVSFETRQRAGGLVAALGEAVQVAPPEGSARVFYATSNTPASSITTGALYPFSSGYTLSGGSCTPTVSGLAPETTATTYKVVSSSTEPAAVAVRLPPLYLTVKTGTTAVSGATVIIKNVYCKNSAEETIKRKYKTTSSGYLGEYTTGTTIPTVETPGLPTGEYEVCASKENKKLTSKVVVRNVEGTTLSMDLAGGTTGECS